MKHAKISRARAWRAPPAPSRRKRPQGVFTALAFNLCLVLLPLAAAAAFIVINRDQLYAYEYSDAGARAVSARVERLNGQLIQLDFDRQRQWDDLIGMELVAGDVSAARGFLLSARGMAPTRAASQLPQGDAELELAALELLTPGTRARYESMVPLLSRRAASGAAVARVETTSVGDAQDFELLARAVLADPNSDPLQFVLTGFALGLGGEFTPRMANGAVSLITASRREDFPPGLNADIDALIAGALPQDAFRRAALADASVNNAGNYDNASAAFRSSVDPARATALRDALDQIGAIGEATSVAAAATLLSHATGLQDLPKLRLIAQSAGDRAAAAAKRLPRDGALLTAARGELTMTRDLFATLMAAGAALAGLLLLVGWKLYQIVRDAWRRHNFEDDDYGGELVDLSNNWRPL